MVVKRLLFINFSLVLLAHGSLFCGTSDEAIATVRESIVMLLNRADAEKEQLSKCMLAALEKHKNILLSSTNETICSNLLICYSAMARAIRDDNEFTYPAVKGDRYCLEVYYPTLAFVYAFGQSGVRLAINVLGCNQHQLPLLPVYEKLHAIVRPVIESYQADNQVAATARACHRDAREIFAYLKSANVFKGPFVSWQDRVYDELIIPTVFDGFIQAYCCMINNRAEVDTLAQCALINDDQIILLWEFSDAIVKPLVVFLGNRINEQDMRQYYRIRGALLCRAILCDVQKILKSGELKD